MKEDQNKKEYSKEELEILEELRSNKNKQGTIESILYGLMQTAHPNMIQYVENQAVQMIKAGKILGQQLKEAESDPEKNRKMSEVLQKAYSQANNGGSSFKDDEDLDI